MAVKQIICTAYSWLGLTTNLKDVNFHNKNINPVKKNSIDLAAYMLKGTGLKYKNKREEIDRIGDSLQLFTTASSLTLNLSNVKKPKLSEFFNIYSADNKFIRYKVEVFENGILEFKGSVSVQDLELSFPSDVKERKIVELTVFAWDAELHEYAANNEMPAPTETQWKLTPQIHGIAVDRMRLPDLVNIFFGIPKNRIIFDSGINGTMNLNKWDIFRHPFLAPGYNILNGYDLIKANFNFSRLDFFKKLCNSMGWVFYLKYNAAVNDIFMIVRNRVTHKSFYSELVLDATKCLGYNIKFSQYGQIVDTLKLPAIELRAGINVLPISEVNGSRDLVYSNLNAGVPSKNLLFFDDFALSGSHFNVTWANDYMHSKFMSVEGGKNKFSNYKGVVVGLLRGYIKGEGFEYPNDFLLEIDGGANSFNMKSKPGVNISNREYTYFSSEQEVGSNDIVYSGCIGTAMAYDDGIGIHQYVHYGKSGYEAYNYSKSAQLTANNTALLTNQDNLNLEYKTYGIYKDLDCYVRFINNYNNAEPAFNFKYDIIDSEIDTQEKTTTFNLRKRNE